MERERDREREREKQEREDKERREQENAASKLVSRHFEESLRLANQKVKYITIINVSSDDKLCKNKNYVIYYYINISNSLFDRLFLRIDACYI